MSEERELPALEEVCSSCRGGGRDYAGRCHTCGGCGRTPTEFGEAVLALVRHNLPDLVRGN